MKIISILGHTGFVGKYCSENLTGSKIVVSSKGLTDLNTGDVIINCVGKCHDLTGRFTSTDYFEANVDFLKRAFDFFLSSDFKVFITLSSVSVLGESFECIIDENMCTVPSTVFGKTKLEAEQYIFSKPIPVDKRVYVLRPCMIHGPGNKGNLNILYNFVKIGLPWPLGLFENQRSFCSIDNLVFIIKELINNENIPTGIYNVADDEPLSTNVLIGLIAKSRNKKPFVWNISKKFIEGFASIGDKLLLPLNKGRLHKLTSSCVVSNAKIKAAIGKPLPVSSIDGLLKTFNSFNNK